MSPRWEETAHVGGGWRDGAGVSNGFRGGWRRSAAPCETTRRRPFFSEWRCRAAVFRMARRSDAIHRRCLRGGVFRVARVSRAGRGVPPRRTSLTRRCTIRSRLLERCVGKVRFGGTPLRGSGQAPPALGTEEAEGTSGGWLMGGPSAFRGVSPPASSTLGILPPPMISSSRGCPIISRVMDGMSESRSVAAAFSSSRMTA